MIKMEGGYTDGDEDVKPNFDMAIDRHAVEEEREERSKAMMQGWLKKEEDVKPEGEQLKEVQEGILKPKGRTLIVMGTYSIGKERIVKGKSYLDPADNSRG
jgi:DNA cross-link repair 1A protein